MLRRHAIAIPVLLAALLLAASCHRGEPAGIVLPRLGTVGMSPYGLSPAPVIVNLRAKGRVTVTGREVTPVQMKAALAPHADAVRSGESFDRESLAWLVLRCDRRVPWRNVQWVMQGAADPAIRIFRIVFAVRPGEGDEECSFAVFLPAGHLHTGGRLPSEKTTVDWVRAVKPEDGKDGRRKGRIARA